MFNDRKQVEFYFIKTIFTTMPREFLRRGHKIFTFVARFLVPCSESQPFHEINLKIFLLSALS